MHEAHAIQARDRTGTRGHRCMARVSRRKPQFAAKNRGQQQHAASPAAGVPGIFPAACG